MCMDKFSKTEFRTPLGNFTGKDVKTFLKTFSNIIKAVISRGLYAVYTLLAVWRVTVALQDPLYWFLLFCIILIATEALHTIIVRKGGELKWITPSVFFYLICAVPPIWLLELKLLKDRQEGANQETTSNVINLDLSDEGWTLALEQILIFALVFGKWIAPKGELTRDQFSQLLLVNLGAGADIIELLESFNEDEVRENAQIVYLIMSVWSWSLLQFCIVPTAYKELPDLEVPIDENIEDLDKTSEANDEMSVHDSNKPDESKITDSAAVEKPKRKTILRSQSEGVNQTIPNGNGFVKAGSVGSSLYAKTGFLIRNNKIGDTNAMTFKNTENMDTSDKPDDVVSENPSRSATDVGETNVPSKTEKENISILSNNVIENGNQCDAVAESKIDPWDHTVIVVHDDEDDLKLEDGVDGWISGRKCCVCFCCYTEIWGMILSLLFQDIPFLITRLFMMLHYNVVSHMTVFFTFKNVVIILLLLNRIRVVVLEEHTNWKKHMNEAMRVRKRNGEILREKARKGMNNAENVTLITNLNSAKGNTNPDRSIDDEIAEPDPITRRKRKWFEKSNWRFWRV